MKGLRRLGALVASVALVGAVVMALSQARASTAVELEVVAENFDGSQGCASCKIDLTVSGTRIDAPGADGDLTGSGTFEAANGDETILNIDKSEIVGTEATFYMMQLTDTSKFGAGAPAKVQIRIMPSEGGPANIRVRDSAGNLLVQFAPGEYTVEMKLHD